MIEFVPMPLIDDFILGYNVGQALLLLFVLSVLGTLPLKSGKLVAVVLISFGLIFVITPSSLAPVHYKYLGLALLLVGPLLYTSTSG